MVQGIAILAAGYGTRLRPLTDELPKPLLPIGDRPLLQRLLERFKEDLPGVPVGINASHLADAIVSFRRTSPVPFELVREDEPLGTAGGIGGIRRLLPQGPLLVWNGDILADTSSAELAGLHEEGARATLFIVPREKGEGNVGLRDDGGVVRLRKVSHGDETRGGDFVGIHILAGDVDLPGRGCIVGDVYLPLLAEGARIVAKPFPSTFVDVGTPEAFLAANLAWLEGRESWVHPSARVRGALRHAIVGEGAVVAGDLEETVVLPNARAEGRLVRAIVTKAGALALGAGALRGSS